MSKILIILVLLLRIPTCRNVDHEFIDGEDMSQKEPHKYYELCLRSMLTVPDSMNFGVGPVVPPVNNLDSKVFYDTLADQTIELRLMTDDGWDIVFRNLTNPEIYDDIESYEFRAYDSKNNIVYLLNRHQHGYFRFFGVSLNTGNQFTVYVNDSRSSEEKMYSWKYSPDMDYLLKSGDLDNDIYGWSLVNLSNGQEGQAQFERYREFVSNIKWVAFDQFSYVLTDIPFWEGYKYDKSYEFYYSLMEGNPLPGIRLKGDKLYPKTYILDVKGHLISEKMTEVQIK